VDARALSNSGGFCDSSVTACPGDGMRDAWFANDGSGTCLLQADEGQMRKHAYARFS